MKNLTSSFIALSERVLRKTAALSAVVFAGILSSIASLLMKTADLIAPPDLEARARALETRARRIREDAER